MNEKENEINIQFHENLKWYCKNKGIKIGEIEESIGVSRGYISRLQGKKTISVGKAYLIAKIFGVSLDDMLSKSLWREEKERELLEQIRALEEEVKKLRTIQ